MQRSSNDRRQAWSADAALAELDRLSILTADLSSMVNASLAGVRRARESIATLGLAPRDEATAKAMDELTQAAGTLERMSEMVHAALQGPSLPIGSPLIAKARPVTMCEALHHAADVLASTAQRQHTSIEVRVPPELAEIPAGPIYTVALNGVQNAVESCARRGGDTGTIVMALRRHESPRGSYGQDARLWLELEILDNGAGLPALSDSRRVFDMGFTTKPGGSGLGLAVARSVVQGLGGSIELAPRAEGGAVLRVIFPAPLASLPRLGAA